MNAAIQDSESGGPTRRKALITGASSGIGYELAKLIAARGYETVLVARRKEKLDALAAELSEHAPSFVVTADLATEATTAAVITQIKAEHPQIDLLLNNAGFGKLAPFLEHTDEDHRRLMQIHYFASASLINALLPGMLERQRGHIINVASIAAKMGPWGHSTYAAAKAALVSLTQSLAAEYPNRGVHFSYVNPGIVVTEFFDGDGYDAMSKSVRKHGIKVETVAAKINKLIDKPKLELTIPGHYRMLDWIKAISPSWAHRIVAKNSRSR